MLEFLDQLIERGSYEECLRASEQLLLSGQSTLPELAAINLTVARCRMWLRDYFGAVPAAQLGFKISKDQGLSYLLPKAFWVLCTAYYYTHQYDSVISTGYDFYQVVPVANQTSPAEGIMCNLIGLAQYHKQEYAQAWKTFLRMRGCYRQARDSEAVLRSVIWVVRCTHALGDHSKARAALAEAMQLARTLPRDHWWHQAVLVQRSDNAFRMGRPERGAYLALRALRLDVKGHKEPKFQALMLLHRYSFVLGQLKDALGYALAARVAALDARLFDLEYEAAEAMVRTMHAASNEDVSELDQEYLSTGVDISRYLPDSVLRNRT